MTMDVELPATMSHYTCVVPLQGFLPRKRLPRTMSEIWIQCFSCCVTDEPPPKRRHRIDRSMIGSPTNFRHTAHVGSGDMNAHLTSLQHQMASKGGYEYAIPVNVQIPVVDVKN